MPALREGLVIASVNFAHVVQDASPHAHNELTVALAHYSRPARIIIIYLS